VCGVDVRRNSHLQPGAPGWDGRTSFATLDSRRSPMSVALSHAPPEPRRLRIAPAAVGCKRWLASRRIRRLVLNCAFGIRPRRSVSPGCLQVGIDDDLSGRVKRVFTRPRSEQGTQVGRQPFLLSRWSLNDNPFPRARADDAAVILLPTEKPMHVIFVRDADDYPPTDEMPSGLSAKHRLTREANTMYEYADSMTQQPTWQPGHLLHDRSSQRRERPVVCNSGSTSQMSRARMRHDPAARERVGPIRCWPLRRGVMVVDSAYHPTTERFGSGLRRRWRRRRSKSTRAASAKFPRG